MNKVLFIIGHEVRGPKKGMTLYTGEKESEYNFRISPIISQVLNNNRIDTRVLVKDGLSHSDIQDKVKEYLPDIVIELHLNSFTGKAYGCECLALGDDNKSIFFADLLSDTISSNFNIKQRAEDGVLKISSGGRGYRNLKIINEALSCPVVIVEPCFANEKTDESERFLSNPKLYGKAIAEACNAYFTARAKQEDMIPYKEYNQSPSSTKEFLFNAVKKLTGDFYGK